jgi:hypothetical protein
MKHLKSSIVIAVLILCLASSQDAFADGDSSKFLGIWNYGNSNLVLKRGGTCAEIFDSDPDHPGGVTEAGTWEASNATIVVVIPKTTKYDGVTYRLTLSDDERTLSGTCSNERLGRTWAASFRRK